MLARDVMSFPVLTVKLTTPVVEATQLLTDHGFTAAPVTADDGRLIGIITEADLLRGRIAADPRRGGSALNRIGRYRPQTVQDVMTGPVESIAAGADICDVARIMVDEQIRCLPIVDGFTVVGVITRRDLLRVATLQRQEIVGHNAFTALLPVVLDPDLL